MFLNACQAGSSSMEGSFIRDWREAGASRRLNISRRAFTAFFSEGISFFFGFLFLLNSRSANKSAGHCGKYNSAYRALSYIEPGGI